MVQSSDWADENVLEKMVMVAQHCKCNEGH